MGFKNRRLRISLSTYLKSITGIYHGTSYCSTSVTNLQVTLTSLKPGIGYLYLNGIYISNDNKAVVLLIVIVAENGSLSVGDPIIITTDPNFDKEPITVQKELGTYSSVEGLDTSEPEENPNLTPYANKEEIHQKLEEFNSEDDILPKVFIGFCLKKNQWCINYTNDTEVTKDSEYILYDTTFDGLLDCVNTAFNLLTSNRTTKEKIVIITSGSTGPSTVNKNSKVNEKNRLSNSVSILPTSYTILDFQENIIYINYSETFSTSSFTYNIEALFEMERGIKYVTICNVNIIGKSTYGAFMAQSSFILFKNFHVKGAKGEYRSTGIGIRAQSQATAIANVELSRWSHDIYFDNCTFDCVDEHGIETFNAYNIYANTIKCTDLGGCGILLNCTYNAWIGEVIAKRCCANATYAATRFANDVGPNINIHYIYGEACGRGVFLVSSSNDIRVDKVKLINIRKEPFFVGGSAGLRIQSGEILTNGGELKYTKFDGTTGTDVASTSTGLFCVNGSSSYFIPQWNNIFENLKIEGFKYGYTERYKMSANYNIYNNIDTSKCTNVKYADSQGTGTSEDIAFNFDVIDGQKGAGYDEIIGDKIISENYTYALASDSESYVIIEYNGEEENVTIPSNFNDKTISRIGSFAFYGNTTLKTLIIDTNIKTIGGLCFGACTSLESVTFNSGGECEIGHCAFRGCTKLSSLDLSGASILRHSCFAWCTGLTTVTCPKNVVYFGGNIFYNCNIDLTIECDDKTLMTVEPYAFYYMGRNSSVTFSAVTEPETLTGVIATTTDSINYYYNSQNYVEENVYKPGIWCKYYYHIAIPLTFASA